MSRITSFESGANSALVLVLDDVFAGALGGDVFDDDVLGDDALAVCSAGAPAVSSVEIACSRTHSAGSISGRSPRNTGARRRPSSVQLENLHSQTNSGRIQVTSFGNPLSYSTGDFAVFSGCIFSYSSFIILRSNPVPTFPAQVSFPRS